MPGVERGGCVDVVGKVTDDLVTEEVQGDAICVAPG
jgi:hypothetical protein